MNIKVTIEDISNGYLLLCADDSKDGGCNERFAFVSYYEAAQKAAEWLIKVRAN